MYKKELEKLCTNSTQKLILGYLCKSSSKNRVQKATLIDVLHIDEREVRRAIAAMRENGIPVASSCDVKGYYIPKNMKEYSEFADRYLHRANTLYRIEKRMRTNAINMYNGQISITNGK